MKAKREEERKRNGEEVGEERKVRARHRRRAKIGEGDREHEG